MTVPDTVPNVVGAWSAVVQAALLGSARTSAGRLDVPSDVAALLGALDGRAERSAEHRLLGQAAVLSTYVRAGQMPARLIEAASEPAPADADDLPVCGAAATALLTTMLVGEHRDVLPEWLARAAANGCRAPATLLPALLDLARGLPPIRAAVPGVLGARGRWLVARNPEWTWAAAGASPETARVAWETGAPAERAAALGVLRGVDPADARARLDATWRAESAAGRATLLASLETALGPDDEPFLEQALDDRGREVRAVAAALLAAIPTSALVARMTERAHAALRYEAGGLLRRARLVVTLPDAPDTGAVRDGVQPTPPPGAGERTWWLAQILAAVPPRTWTDAWGVSAPRAIELARESEWTEPLADGWARATLRARDVAWADALLRANVLVDRHARLAPPRAHLLALLDVGRREALLADALGGRALIDPGELLAGATHAWNEPFARDVLGWLRRRAQAAAERPDARPADDWRVVELLAAFALRVPPALAGAAIDGWPDALPPAWARAVERLVAVLTFRRALDAAFTSPHHDDPVRRA